jgi:hypothetical protein
MDQPDDLDDYLQRGSALSRRYRRESAPAPPHTLDRRVLEMSRRPHGKSPCLAPLALAASILLSVALVLAIVFGPQTTRRVDGAPHLVRVAARADASANQLLNRKPQLYSSDPKFARAPALWLADIAALRRAGRNSEAEAQLRRFRGAYPGYAGGESGTRP